MVPTFNRNTSRWGGTITTAATLKSLPGRRAILNDLAPSLYPKVQYEEKDHCIKQYVAHKHKEFRAAVQLSHKAWRKHSATRPLGDAAQPSGTPVATRSQQRTCPNQASAHEQGRYDCEDVLHTFRRNSVCRSILLEALSICSRPSRTENAQGCKFIALGARIVASIRRSIVARSIEAFV